MRRICAALATVVSVVMLSTVLAGPAWGKGPESATITGPGLDEPIEVFGTDGESAPSYLVIALTDLTYLWDTSNAGMTPEAPPDGTLQERYTLTWRMFGPSEEDEDGDEADYTVRQDLYPNAFGGPRVHVHPSEFLGTDGGWFEAGPALRDTLAALGVPVTGIEASTALADHEAAVSGAGAESGAPAQAVDQGDAAAVRETSTWPATATAAVAGAAAAGIALGVGLGSALARRRARGQGPVVQAA